MKVASFSTFCSIFSNCEILNSIVEVLAQPLKKVTQISRAMSGSKKKIKLRAFFNLIIFIKQVRIYVTNRQILIIVCQSNKTHLIPVVRLHFQTHCPFTGTMSFTIYTMSTTHTQKRSFALFYRNVQRKQAIISHSNHSLIPPRGLKTCLILLERVLLRIKPPFIISKKKMRS